MDPVNGILDTSLFPPDFLIRHPNILKAKKTMDPDSPGIVEALSGPYREDFLEAMKNEITELENHGTWEIIPKSEVPPDAQILAGTWVYKIKRFPSGLMKKIKARFCARGDLQTDVDVHDTYAPVASWSSIRMLMITALQKGWITKQVDFSNAFVQAPMEREVFVSLPSMFTDTNGIL